MGYKEALNKMELASDITPVSASLTMNWQKEAAGFDVFNFLNQDEKPVKILDDADYLKLYMQIAERLFQNTKDKSSTYLISTSLGGDYLYLKIFTDEEREKYKYAYIALNNAIKALPEDLQPKQLNFFAEVTYEDSSSDKFEKESAKVAKILKGENREDWQVVADNCYDFLKTDLYVFTLFKLHSWGFQIVKPGDETDSKFSMVRPIRPKPRGAVREKRKA